MRKVKRISLVLLVVLCCFGILACSTREDKEETPTTSPASETVETPTEKPTSTVEPTGAPGSTVSPELIATPEVAQTPSPTKLSEEDRRKRAQQILDTMTLEEKIGQMFIVNLEQLDTSQGKYYDFRNITDSMVQTIAQYPVGGVVLFSRNIDTREQTMQLIKSFQTTSKYPLFVSVDEEGGEIVRIANNENMLTTKFPTMEEVGATKSEEYAYDMGATIGHEIKDLGFNLDFAPVADVKTNEANTEIGSRSFGSDPDLVAKMVKQVVKGMQDQNISATLKHFPGHGDVSSNSHMGSVNVDNSILRMRKIDFVPFVEGIEQGVDFIMISHISISRVTESAIPASLSSIVIKDVLREELGFEGIVITDAMDMTSITEKYLPGEAAVKSIKAGTDIILMSDDFVVAYQAVLDAVNNKDINQAEIDASVLRILSTKLERGIIL